MSAETSRWRSGSLSELSCDASTMTRSGRPRGGELAQRLGNLGGAVVVGVAAAAQDHVAVRVAGGPQDRRSARRIDPGEGVARGRGAHGVDGDLDVAVGPVLEADGHREARAELAMDLALGRPRTDRAPGNGVGDVLRGDRVEELATDGQAELDHGQEQPARPAQGPVFTSPESSRCGSLIIPFHPVVVRGFSKYTRITTSRSSVQLPRLRGETARVVARRLGVVHAAGADDDQEPVVRPVEDRRHLFAASDHELRPAGGSGSSSMSSVGETSDSIWSIRRSRIPSRSASPAGSRSRTRATDTSFPAISATLRT